MAESAKQAMLILRQPTNFQWYVIPILMLVLYVYANEVEKRNWNVVFAGLAFWGMDWFNEIWNGLVFDFTNYAPLWGAPSATAFSILIGLNIEITLMFAIAGIVCAKMLPANPSAKILGVPNRAFFAVLLSILFVCVEEILHGIGVLTWEYSWWNTTAPWLVFLIGYLPFLVVSFWVHDTPSLKRKIGITATIFSIDAVGLLLFGVILHWI